MFSGKFPIFVRTFIFLKMSMKSPFVLTHSSPDFQQVFLTKEELGLFFNAPLSNVLQLLRNCYIVKT